jgi:hypothetical protein
VDRSWQQIFGANRVRAGRRTLERSTNADGPLPSSQGLLLTICGVVAARAFRAGSSFWHPFGRTSPRRSATSFPWTRRRTTSIFGLASPQYRRRPDGALGHAVKTAASAVMRVKSRPAIYTIHVSLSRGNVQRRGMLVGACNQGHVNNEEAGPPRLHLYVSQTLFRRYPRRAR